MKTNLKSAFSLMAIVMLLFASCDRDEVSVEDNANFETEVTVIDTDIVNNQTSSRDVVTDQRVLDLIDNLELDVASVTKGDFHLPDGTVEQRIYIGDDIVVTKEELVAMQTLNDTQGRQYRTNNLVNTNGGSRVISVIGYTGAPFALTTKGRTALQNAINNYNTLYNNGTTTLRFSLTFATSTNADMVVYDNSVNNSGSGGVAGFPSSGNPNKFCQIYNLEGFSAGVNEHVITHEMGHSIGFRHTDWFSRQSCGQNSNEGDAGVGAVHLTGTPTGYDSTSLMLACFSTSVSGNFNGNDVTGLGVMYPTSSGGSICDGVPQWQPINYPVGARVVYQGNLYERTSGGWTLLGPC
ncbi:M57 family metalloprotease [uncultured Dokdonia sp.]|uniref:M57 family metalloprotease n=1 Tax=uncultured Dokdonia sp. TaxID=575653 RepID=UPI002602F17E|nr:M57 family metalloprotease [uncultured Dokdonia sp.]